MVTDDAAWRGYVSETVAGLALITGHVVDPFAFGMFTE
jgi:hypothetical protein